ncbi:multi antimicrobial extrusion protein MatE [Paenibacillus psychroresistens]|uniref:Multi antimicrobial extrusion protein MatE n=1 Tax=Paenibacillus psychroresistens TaxID=1778678 RepID=A0A6B8RT82_9BACL|nr:multi antimicrobial extrusion protein MatE [Paenibacillus psychroresistens]QGQ99004.1 multi antimicrobial extrusion protein MatE [Paenibacillus psychroresistens]
MSLGIVEEQPKALSQQVTQGKLFRFFIPLGLSASLVTISHVIITSTLAQSKHPEIVISSYAIAMSLIGVTERPAVLLRQTCSNLVRDKLSFKAVSDVALYVFISIIVFGLLICYTPLGRWVFQYVFGVNDTQVHAVIGVYRVLMYVSIFSGIRCLYHGIIIYNRKTTWLTIGMIFRLISMYAVAQYFISTDSVNSGKVGAIIFLMGMFVESLCAVFEGRSLLKKTIPDKLQDHPVVDKKQVFQFYRPLLYSSAIAVIAAPAINIVLGKTLDLNLTIASFAVASSVVQLVLSFFSYMHQIVLNFYRHDEKQAKIFLRLMGGVPALLLAVLVYTPVGAWLMQSVMGVKESLASPSLEVLKVFLPMALIFPLLDFLNGILMLTGQTKVMIWSQVANVLATLITLIICIGLFPSLNGIIGALAQSAGIAGELGMVVYILQRNKRTMI